MVSVYKAPFVAWFPELFSNISPMWSADLPNFFIVCFLIISVIPQFEYIPPPVTYFDEQSPHLTIPLTCRGWPPQPFSSISYYTVSRLSVPGVSPTATAPRQIPLYPVREALLTNSSTGLSGILLSNLSEITEMSEQNMHCVISTLFGSILSPPFRLMRAGEWIIAWIS